MLKHERDLMLSLACLLSQALVFAICYQRDKFERYVQFKAEEEERELAKKKE